MTKLGMMGVAVFGAALGAHCVVAPQPQPTGPGYHQPGYGQPPQESVNSGSTEAVPAPAPSPERLTIRARAPMSINDHYLGRPFDVRFESFAGEEGRTLFQPAGTGDVAATPDGNSAPDSASVPHSGAALAMPADARPVPGIIITPQNMMMHEALVIESVRELQANASVWGIGSAEIAAGNERRYATYRVWQVTEVHEIDDTASMRQAPPGALWYLSRIYYGHSYQVVLFGDRETFHGGVKAEFLTVGSVGIEGFAQDNKLQTKQVGRGLVPTGTAIFAKSPSEVEKNYSAEGPITPIFAEYRLIPGATLPADQAIDWRDTRLASTTGTSLTAGKYRIREIQIWIAPRRDGRGWDPGGRPDPMIDVNLDGKPFFSCREDDVALGQPVLCTIDKTVHVTSTTELSENVTDRDISEHDQIGAATTLVSRGNTSEPFEMAVTGSLNKATLVIEGPL